MRLINNKGIDFTIITTLIVLAIFVAHAPYVYNRTYIVDLFGFSDGFYRVSLGEKPHIDFMSPTGFLHYYAGALLLHLGAKPLEVLRLYQLSVSFIALFMLYYLHYTRLSRVVFLLAVLLIISTLVAQLNLGEDIRYVTGAMFYNRIGFCALAIMILCFVPTKSEYPLYDAVFLSLITVFLLLTKITFGLVALTLIALYGLSEKKRIKTVIYSLGFIAFILGAIQIKSQLIGFYLQDIAAIAKIAPASLGVSGLIYVFIESAPMVFLCILIPLYLLWQAKQLALFHILIAGLCYSCGILLTLTGTQWGNIFLPFAFLLYSLAIFEQDLLDKVKNYRFILGLSVSFIVFSSIGNLINIGFYAVSSYKPRVSTSEIIDFGAYGKLASYIPSPLSIKMLERFMKNESERDVFLKSRVIQDLTSYDHFYQHEYVHTLAFGVAAAHKFCGAQDGVMALDFSNPYSAILKRKPTSNVVFIHPNRTVSEAQKIDFKLMFRNADCLLEARLPHAQYTQLFLMQLYSQELSSLYQRVGETDYFIIHRLKSKIQ